MNEKAIDEPSSSFIIIDIALNYKIFKLTVAKCQVVNMGAAFESFEFK